MSRHLTSIEFVDAAEGTLGAERLAHLSACAACAAEAESLRGLGDAMKASTPAAEPSPLFWDHFSQRVQAATRAERVPAPGWGEGWRAFVALGLVAAAALVLTLQVRQARVFPQVASEVALAPSTAGAVAEPPVLVEEVDDALAFVAQAAAQVPLADLQQGTRPTLDAADAALDQLSAEQRAELVRLLKAHIGRGED